VRLLESGVRAAHLDTARLNVLRGGRTRVRAALAVGVRDGAATTPEEAARRFADEAEDLKIVDGHARREFDLTRLLFERRARGLLIPFASASQVFLSTSASGNGCQIASHPLKYEMAKQHIIIE
jgi:hypothetical protein